MCPNCRHHCGSHPEIDFYCCPKRKAVEFDCNIILQEGSCAVKKREKRQQIREACQQHRQRIEELSTPRRIFRESEPEKCAGKPLRELIPRLRHLSQPRWCTPKYVRPKSEEFCLPGAITDWEANKRWASKRAQPKKDFSQLLLELQAKKCGRSTINCEGIQRIERLAKPRSRYMKCKAKPSSRNYHSCCLECSTDRILKLSEPKPRVEQNNDFRPLSSVLKVSESAKAYEGECEFTEKQNFLSESHNGSV